MSKDTAFCVHLVNRIDGLTKHHRDDQDWKQCKLFAKKLKTDAVFTIYMAAETEFLYIESETVRKHENITIGSFNMELLPCNFLIEIECFYEIKE